VPIHGSPNRSNLRLRQRVHHADRDPCRETGIEPRRDLPPGIAAREENMGSRRYPASGARKSVSVRLSVSGPLKSPPETLTGGRRLMKYKVTQGIFTHPIISTSSPAENNNWL